jgi:transposase
VSVACVAKRSQRFRRLGSAAQGKFGVHGPFVLAGERDWLVSRIAEKRIQHWRRSGHELPACRRAIRTFTVWYLLKREGLSIKKTLHPAEALREDMARRRDR